MNKVPPQSQVNLYSSSFRFPNPVLSWLQLNYIFLQKQFSNTVLLKALVNLCSPLINLANMAQPQALVNLYLLSDNPNTALSPALVNLYLLSHNPNTVLSLTLVNLYLLLSHEYSITSSFSQFISFELYKFSNMGLFSALVNLCFPSVNFANMALLEALVNLYLLQHNPKMYYLQLQSTCIFFFRINTVSPPALVNLYLSPYTNS